MAIRRDAPRETLRISSIVAKLHQHDVYRRMVLQGSIGAEAIEAAKRGRSLRSLARAVGLSPTYLSLVSTGKQPISVSALFALLGECEGVEKLEPAVKEGAP
jgi:hypothetical protein